MANDEVNEHAETTPEDDGMCSCGDDHPPHPVRLILVEGMPGQVLINVGPIPVDKISDIAAMMAEEEFQGMVRDAVAQTEKAMADAVKAAKAKLN